jgi:hypothetical protein
MTTTALGRTILNSVPCALAVALTACWTAPVANVQPRGEPRMIQSCVSVESVKYPVTVQSLDPSARTIVMRTPGAADSSRYRLAPGVSNFQHIKAGDVIEATVVEELTVYVPGDGQLPHTGSVPEAIAVDARVLSVDPSYRLLTLQYPNGANETFKVPLRTKLGQMESGDSVVIRTVEVVALRRKV